MSEGWGGEEREKNHGRKKTGDWMEKGEVIGGLKE